MPFDENEAHEVGRLLARTRTADVVDAFVVVVAVRFRACIVTGDVEDINRLVAASGGGALVVAI